MMNYLQEKKKAMLNAIQSQPSGYDVTIRTYETNNYYVDVTINGVTITYTMNEVRANPVDCGCIYLTYMQFGGMTYDIVSKGTLTYNGVEYPKGKIVNRIAFNNFNTFEYSGVNEPTPSGTTEFYMPNNNYIVFADTDYAMGDYSKFPSFTQIGCIEFMYGSGATTVNAIKDLTYNGTTYLAGSQIFRKGYPTTMTAIFEEI